MNKLIYVFFIGAMGLSLFSCSDEYTICDSPLNVNLNGSFYKDSLGVAVIKQPSSFSISELNGTVIYTNSDRTAFFLSLNPNTDTSRFVITLEGNTPDTFKVAYSTQVQTVSPNCGNVNIFNISGVITSKNTVDSIVLANPSVNTFIALNIKVFY
jgi:hypothetical protein